eukprot:7472194-Alexandrium_andersonii.AAC.1
MEFRFLTILPACYRLWGKLRLRQLSPWCSEWDPPELYTGTHSKGAEEAWLQTALEAEIAMLGSVDMQCTAINLFECFGTVPRSLLYTLMAVAGIYIK